MTLYAALLLGYTIHFIYCIWGNLRITVAELIAAALQPLAACRYSGERQCNAAAASSGRSRYSHWGHCPRRLLAARCLGPHMALSRH